MKMRILPFVGVALVGTACRQAGADPQERCAVARTEATGAWDAILPAMRTAATEARLAAANCDGPTRDQPPCSGRMSDRFLEQSVTAARLSEVEAAREAASKGDPVAISEATREVKDAPRVASAKKSAENAYAICVTATGVR